MTTKGKRKASAHLKFQLNFCGSLVLNPLNQNPRKPNRHLKTQTMDVNVPEI